MQLPSPLASRASAPARYVCNWHNFSAGAMDWWAERCRAPKPGTSAKSGGGVAFFSFGVAALFVLALAGGISLIGPSLAGGMAAVGTGAIAAFSMALTLVGGVLFLAGLPLWAGWKTQLFVKAMCLRGWELHQGLRTRA